MVAGVEAREKRILGPEGVLALLLVAALPAVFGPAFTDLLVLRDAVLVVGGAGVLVLWCVQLARGVGVNLRAVGLQGFLWALVVIGFVSALWATDRWASVGPAGALLAMAAVALAVLAPTGRPISLRALVLAATSGLLVGGGLVLASLFGATMLLPPKPYPSSVHWVVFDLACYAAVTLPLALATALRYDGATRVVSAVGAVLAAAILGLTRTDEALWAFGAAAVVGPATLLLLRGTRPAIARMILGLLCAGAVVVLTGVVELPAEAPLPRPEAAQVADPMVDPLRSIPAGIDRQVPAFPRGGGARAFLVASGLMAFADHPLQGVGLGQTPQTVDQYRPANDPYFSASFEPLPTFASLHSAVTQLAAELGLLGLLPLLGLLGLLTVHLLRAVRSCPDEAVDQEQTLGGVVTAGVAGIILLFTAPALQLPATAVLLATLVGAAAALSVTFARTGFGLSGWSVAGTRGGGRTELARVLGVGALPIALVAALCYVQVQVVVGNYQRQWGNLLLLSGLPGQAQQALERYGAAAHANPGDAHALFMTGTMQLEMLQFDEAGVSLGKAQALRPHDERLLESRARLARLRQHFKDAKRLYLAALDQHPRYVEAHIGLSKTLGALGDRPGALAQLRQALDADPPPELAASLHLELARAYLVDSKRIEAERQLDMAAAIARPRRLNLDLAPVYREVDRLRAQEKAKKDAAKKQDQQVPAVPGMPGPFDDHGDGHGGHGAGLYDDVERDLAPAPVVPDQGGNGQAGTP